MRFLHRFFQSRRDKSDLFVSLVGQKKKADWINPIGLRFPVKVRATGEALTLLERLRC